MISNYLNDDATPLEQAEYELKRVDHLIYVSLKYTRTVDVIKNIIHRLISTFDFIWEDFLKRAEEDQKIFEIPTSPGAKCTELKKIYSDDKQVIEFINFYLKLRKFHNAEYTSHQEFRRHVTMKAVFQDGDEQELNIDIITEYYKQTKDFLEYVNKEYYTDE